MIQISKLILAVTGEPEIHAWHDVISQHKIALVDKSLRVDLSMLQSGFVHVSLFVAILTKLFHQITNRN